MKKKIALICTAVVLVAAIAVGGTLALLTDSTDKVQNTFTVGKGISIDLKEPDWDGVDFDGNTSTASEDLGENLAQNFVPSRVIPKDPTVKNTSAADSVWIAVKVNATCGAAEGDAAALAAIQNFADINWNVGNADGNGANWVQKDGDTTIYYYNAIVASQAETEELFTTVTIKDTAAQEDLSNFEIDVTAYAIQAEGVKDLAAAQAAFAKEFTELA